ncbi:MAG: Gfo/Idh/MocA family oxidoreductase [Verrucomicrobiales bacterium]|jgi:predicted dehydrogenase|nr:Gfo/Idh/MocA family oxidoreductase [Verrucomicrobiales bacterium]
MSKIISALSLLAVLISPLVAEDRIEIRVGMVGLDTSHAPAFTKILNDPEATHGVKVVAGVPAFSPDIESSASRIDQFVETLTKDYGVKMYESIEAMLPHVDVVMIESVDGRPHLAQATPGIMAGKPTFIDKPVAASLEDAVAIYDLAKKHDTPVWSSSNLRFHAGVVSAATTDVGEIAAVISFGPASLEPNHLDLAWYGIHSTEALFTVIGTGCLSVSRTHTEGTDVVTGIWEGGKTGTLLGLRKSKTPFGLRVFGTKKVIEESAGAAYPELMAEMVKFFKTGEPPVSPETTLEIFAFMAAADESKARDGAPVTLAEMMKKARAE